VKHAAGNLDSFPRLQRLAYDMHRFSSQGDAQFFNHGFRHNGPAVAKMDHATNAPGVADLAETCRQVKSREQVIRDQSLREPNRPPPRGALKPNARQVNLDARFPLEVRRRNVLVLGLRANAKPCWRMPGRSVIDKLAHFILGFASASAAPHPQSSFPAV
jgi:hypothetical protein